MASGSVRIYNIYRGKLKTIKERTEMTLCPIALMVGCKKCLVFAFCPVKGIIGDYIQTKHEKKKESQNKKNKNG